MKDNNQLAAVSIFLALLSILIGYKYNLVLPGSDVFVNVETQDGTIRGFKATARDGRTYYEFRGVPYALPPVGELRFEPPVRFPKWNGTINALSYGQKCMQHDLFLEMELGDEDCLYLNVYTPKLPLRRSTTRSKRLLPVLIFFHGGVFMFGASNEYRPQYFMDEDVVLVTLNYRLASFGFLNTGDGVVAGNMGLKDQVMSLEWIRDNIASFGGNPNLVTIFGESAGGASVHYHMLSPMSKGLFHRAISMSGTALNHWAFNPKPKEQAGRFLKKIGCPTHATSELIQCLKALPAWKINSVHEENLLNPVLHYRDVIFVPSAEIPTNQTSKTTFLSSSPSEIIGRNGILNNVPYLQGVNSHEGMIYALGILKDTSVQDELNTKWDKWAPILFDYEDMPKAHSHFQSNISSQIKEYYFKHLKIGSHSLYEMINLFSDASFNEGLKNTIQSHSNKSHQNSQDMFLYFNSHLGNFGLGQIYFHRTGFLPHLLDSVLSVAMRWFGNLLFGWKEKFYGTCHGDEIGLLFRFDFLSNLKAGDDEYAMSKALVKTWVHFAKFGHPKKFRGINWPAASSNEGGPLGYMLISENPAIIEEPFTRRIEFWRQIRDRTGIKRW